MSKKVVARIVIAIVLIILIIRFFTTRSIPMIHLTGETMGSIQYNVKYLDSEDHDLKAEIDSILIRFNQSLSTYIPDSEISRINSTLELRNPSPMMLKVLSKSEEVWLTTYGAFDPTIGPLVNAWGFGPGKVPDLLDSLVVDSLLQYVGFGKILFDDSFVRIDPGMYLDFSAIAKGYAVDLVADFLEGNDLHNYMVEIGGEVRVKGENDKGEPWRIGIEDPMVSINERKLLAISSFTDRAMATSGDYRNYYQLEGRTIAHTIDPRTGYSMRNNILSATVFADDCMTADAFATAFMVLGFEASLEVLNHTAMDAVFVYDESGEKKIFISPAIQEHTELVGEFKEALEAL